mgnify:CR=1 FL=1
MSIDVGPHTIPKGATIMIASDAIHMSSKYYKNPDEFDPDHFSPEAVENRPTLAFFPFSAGARNCIGNAWRINGQITYYLLLIIIYLWTLTSQCIFVRFVLSFSSLSIYQGNVLLIYLPTVNSWMALL